MRDSAPELHAIHPTEALEADEQFGLSDTSIRDAFADTMDRLFDPYGRAMRQVFTLIPAG